jgi:DNA polymerase-4
MDSAALQRVLLTGLSLRADDLLSAGQAADRLSLDGERAAARLAAQEAVDRVRAGSARR